MQGNYVTATPDPTAPLVDGRQIVLATFGTHGDLNPFLALALALQQQGLSPVLATAEDYRQKVEASGIAFHPMRPSRAHIGAYLHMDQQQLVRAVAAKPQFLFRRMLFPFLRESFDDAMAAMPNAALVVTNSIAFGAMLAAEKSGLPRFTVVLQPLALLSVNDPPVLADLPRLTPWIYRHSRLATRALLALGRQVSRRWARPLARFRREVGLPPAKGHPLFEGAFGDIGTLAMFSPLLGRPQADHPANTSIVGFAFHDSEAGKTATLAPALSNFLANGPPPVVFTLGTSAVNDAEDFVRESLAAVDKLNVRAVFVLDDEQRTQWQPRCSDSVFFSAYVPYSLLFQRARIIVHHGGAGTTAQALRAGRPQLITPQLVDQPDNAARVVDLGVAISLPPRRYRSKHICAALQRLMQDEDYQSRAKDLAQQLSGEDGAALAATILSDFLAQQVESPTVCSHAAIGPI